MYLLADFEACSLGAYNRLLPSCGARRLLICRWRLQSGAYSMAAYCLALPISEMDMQYLALGACILQVAVGGLRVARYWFGARDAPMCRQFGAYTLGPTLRRLTFCGPTFWRLTLSAHRCWGRARNHLSTGGLHFGAYTLGSLV